MDHNNPGTGDLQCLTLTTGVPVALVASPAASIGQTLGVATYVFPVGSSVAVTPSQTALIGLHLRWAAAVAGTITIEFCNFPAKLGMNNAGGDDVTDYSANDWVPWNPGTAGAFTVQVTGAGNSVTALTLTAGGTNAGTAFINLPDSGCRRIRVKVVASAGGLVRINARGKFGE